MTSFRARPLTLGLFFYLLGVLALTMTEGYKPILLLSVGLFALFAILAALMFRKRTAKRGYSYPLLLSVSFLLLFCHSLSFCHFSLFPAMALRGGTHTMEVTVEACYLDYAFVRTQDGVKLALDHPESEAPFDHPEQRQRVQIRFESDEEMQDPKGEKRAQGALVTGQWTQFTLLETVPLSPWEELRLSLCSLLSPLRNADLVSAVLLGEGDTDPSTENALNTTQTQHILSVSGLHVSVLLLGLRRLLNKLRLSRGKQGFLLLFCCLFYAALLDFAPSVCRAAVMTLMAYTAGSLRKNNDSITTLFVSAALLVFFDPFVLYDPSFQLSFLATLGILRIYLPLAHRLEISGFFRKDVAFPLFLARGLLKEGLLALLMSVAAVGFSLPTLLSLSPEVNLLSFFANVILVVLFVPVLLAGTLYLLLSLLLSCLSLPSVLSFFTVLCDGILDVFGYAVSALQNTAVSVPLMAEESFGLTIALCTVFLFVIFLLHDRKVFLPLGLLLSLFPLLGGLTQLVKSERIACVTWLNTPLQQALLVQKEEKSLLYLPDGVKTEGVLYEMLSLQEVSHLDAVILGEAKDLEYSLSLLHNAYGADAYYLPSRNFFQSPKEKFPLLPIPSKDSWEPIPDVWVHCHDLGDSRSLDFLTDETLFCYRSHWSRVPTRLESSFIQKPNYLFFSDAPLLALPEDLSQLSLFCDESYPQKEKAKQILKDSCLLRLWVYPHYHQLEVLALEKEMAGNTQSKLETSLAEVSGTLPLRGSLKYE